MINVGVLQAVLTLRDNLTGGLRSATKGLGGFVGSSRTAQVAIGALGATMLATSAQAVESSANFDRALREVATISDETAAGFERVKEQVLDLAPQLGESAELTRGLYQAISAGAEDVDAGLRIVVQSAKLAKASLADAAVTTDALTTVINAYGLSADAAEDVSDKFFATVRLGKTTMTELAPVIGRVIPIAASLGVEFDEVSAAIATLTAGGIKTDEAITALRAAMTSLLKPTQEAQQLAAQLGFELGPEFIRKAGGFLPAMQKIKEATGGSAEAMATLFPNVRGLTGVLSLAGKQSEAFAENLREVRDSSGATERAFDEMKKSFSETRAAAGAALEKLKIVIGDSLTPALDLFSRAVIATAEALRQMPEPIRTFIAVLLPVGGVLASVTAAVTLFGGALGGLTTAITAAMAVLSGPAGLIAILGVGAVVALTRMRTASDAAREALRRLKTETTEMSSAAEDFVEAFDAGLGGLKEFARQVKPTLDDIRDLKSELLRLQEQGVIKSVDKLERMFKVLDQWQLKLRETKAGLEAATGSAIKAGRVYKVTLPEGLNAARDGFRFAAEAANDAAAATDVAARETDRWGAALQRVASSLPKYTELLEDAARDYISVGASVRDATDDLGKFNAEFLVGVPAVNAHGEAMSRWEVAVGAAQAAAEAAIPTYRELIDTAAAGFVKAGGNAEALAAAQDMVREETELLRGEFDELFLIGEPTTGPASASFWDRLRASAASFAEQLPSLLDVAERVFGVQIPQSLRQLGNAAALALKGEWGDALSVASAAVGEFSATAQAALNAVAQFIKGNFIAAIASAVTALVGLFKGLFGKTNAAKEISKQFGLELSKALTEEIQKIGEQHGRDFGAAFRLALAKVIDEVGIDTVERLKFFLTETRNIFADFDRQTISSKEAVSAIGDAVVAMLPAFQDLGQSLSVLTEPGGVLSDMVSRLKQGQLSAEQVREVFNRIAQAAVEMGIEGVDALRALAAEAGITLDALEGVAAQGKSAFQEWAESIGISFEGFNVKTRKDFRLTFLELVKNGTLSRETLKAILRGALAEQEDALKKFRKSQRDELRAQADAWGLTEEQKREFVRASMKAIRQAERAADKERRQELRGQVRDFRSAQDDMARIGELRADRVRLAWIRAAREATAAWRDANDALVGRSYITDIGRGAEQTARQIADSFVASASTSAEAFRGISADVSISRPVPVPAGGAPAPVPAAGAARRQDRRLVEEVRGLRSDVLSLAAALKRQQAELQLAARDRALMEGR